MFDCAFQQFSWSSSDSNAYGLSEIVYDDDDEDGDGDEDKYEDGGIYCKYSDSEDFDSDDEYRDDQYQYYF